MKIALMNTGGTISCVGNPLNPMSAAQFADACKKLLRPIFAQGIPDLSVSYITDLIFEESKYGTLDSTNLQPTDWCLMAKYILQHYSQYDGWVILHGTDTMDFTGTALPFLLSAYHAKGIVAGALSKPIIITGSQVPLFFQATPTADLTINFNTDAFQNICGAMAAAQTGIPEVCIYFQNNLYRGNRVVKTNASEFNAFSSPNYPTLGEYGVALSIDMDNVLPLPVNYAISLDNPTVLNNILDQLTYIQSHINQFPVIQINAFPAYYSMSPADGFLAAVINTYVGLNVKGLILESYGEGNFPSGNPDDAKSGSIYKALQKANESNVVMIDCTQVISGVVNDVAYLAGAWLPLVGVLGCFDMTPMAAFAKLMILMTAAGYPKNNWDIATVKKLVQTNLLGEMMSINRLDSRINATLLPGQKIYAQDGSATLTNDPINGPVLINSNGATLWAAFGTPPPPTQMPGRLTMQNDGNLVFYSRHNTPLWATNTGVASGASSILSIDGSASNNTSALTIYDYSTCTQTCVLYPRS